LISGFLNEPELIRRNVTLRENRARWTDTEARTAVNAVIGVNEELIVALVNAIHGADFDARAVLHTDAGLSNHREASHTAQFASS
jgi:hypothetical protein